ncbi:MAG: hypothetical protein HY507_00090 [Candidatus Zambryskibacteria bacterium]|nr:hypothetical protein [Candidatus Zambryskibacteria bacterium]
MNKGFISIPVIIAIVVIILASGVVVHNRVKIPKKEIETNNTSLDKPPQVQSQNLTPKSSVGKNNTMVNMQQEFTLIEGEVRGAQEKSHFFHLNTPLEF